MTPVEPGPNGSGNGNVTLSTVSAADPDRMDEEHQIERDHQRRLEAIEVRLRANTKKLVRIACVALLLPLVWAGLLIWEHQKAQQVVSVQPIGMAVHLRHQNQTQKSVVVLETATGFYPLLEPVVIPKDIPLILETRAGGRRYVCNATRSNCARTAKASLQTP